MWTQKPLQAEFRFFVKKAMKTIEEFCVEISNSKELQEELNNLSPEALKAFLEKHGCEADVKEFLKFVREHSEGEIDDEDATAVAGGGGVYSRPLIRIDVTRLP